MISAAGTTYEQYVAGARPDVLVEVRQHAWDKVELQARARRAGVRALAELDDGRSGRHDPPVLWEPGTDPPPSPIVPDVPLYHAWVDAPLPPARPLAERIAALLAPARDPTVRSVECEALVALGRQYLARGDAARANALFATALAVRPGDAAATVDLAVVRARGGDLPGALALVEAVLARDPDRYVARLNAARYRLVLGDLEGAGRDFTAARELAGDAVAPLVGLSRVAEARGDRATARHLLRTAEKIDSSDTEVRTLHKELEP